MQKKTPGCGWMRNYCRLAVLLFVTSSPAWAADWVYTVVEGDNLWDFSERHLDSALRYRQLQRLNNIQMPRRLQPGSHIRVPMKWIRSNPSEARVTALRGQVRLLRHGNSHSEPTRLDEAIRLGDLISTAADSSVAIRFADDSVITLHQNSEMRFDHLSAHGDTGMVDSRVRLLEGRLNTRVEPAQGPGSRFEIHTPSAISAVRGTEYRAAVESDSDISRFEVVGGRVAVSNEHRSRLLNSGYGVRVAANQAPKKPRPLLPAPLLDPYPERIRQADWILRWQRVPGAVAYKLEIGAGLNFDVLALERRVEVAKSPLPDLPDGEYAVRVRAIAEDGLEGHDRVVKLLLDTHPRPPVPLKPGVDQVVRGEAAQLQWTDSADAAGYLLQLASDRGFTDGVREIPVESTRYSAEEFQLPGEYHWRVASIAADGEQGPFTLARGWQQKAEPEGVNASLSGDDGQLTAAWRRVADSSRYQVQLAYDSAFEELELDQLLQEPSMTFAATPGQVRYLRVRVIEEDGYQGPWGAVQRIDPPVDESAWFIPLLGILGVLAI